MKTSPDSLEFSTRLKALRQCDDTQEAAAELTRLAHFDLEYLQVIQLARAFDAADTALPVVRLAIVSSCTVDHLAAGIRVAGLRHNLDIQLWCGQFGQYRQEVLGPSEALKTFAPDFVLFSMHADHLCAGIPVDIGAAQAGQRIDQRVGELAAVWQAARREFGAAVIAQTCLNTSEPLFGNYDRMVSGSPYRLAQLLNDALTDQARKDGVGLLDVARQCARDGLAAWYDHARWLQAKMNISPTASLGFGELLSRHIGAARGTARKCLVLDLDNTLWGGVIGDDGVEGICIGEGSAAGEAFLGLQRYAKSLQQRGIILAVCSKNEDANARAPFSEHPDMHLSLDDFAVFVANWNDKAANLEDIAERLNLGLDSFVFVDDNPAERARVRESLPMVAVPELPLDPAGYVACLANQGYFEAVAFTADDQARSAQYAANAQRGLLAQSLTSHDDYLRSLDMRLRYGAITPVDLVRSTQLIGKTNQFNTTTIRYSAEQISAFIEDKTTMTLQCRLADRFGDNGLVSAMILTRDNRDKKTFVIAIWVMSCRVFGRQLEQEMMNIAVKQARDRGVRFLVGLYSPTAKNAVIRSLYSDFGFELEPASTDSSDGQQRWRMRLDDYRPISTHIAHEE